MNIKYLACAVAVTGLLSGCNITKNITNGLNSIVNVFTAPKAQITYLKPANKAGTEQMVNVAIISDGGVASFFESELNSVQVESKPFFKLVDRNLTDKIIKEQKFSESMFADSSSRVSFGKITGADSLFTGSLQTKFSSENYTETRSKCLDKKCKQTSQYNVSCKARTAFSTLTAKSTSVQSGQIIFSEVYSGMNKDAVCSDSNRSLDADQKLAALALGQIARRFKSDIAPHDFTYKVELMEGDDSDMPEAAEKLFDLGVEFAEKDNLKSACLMFKKAQSSFANSPAITYNNAVCLESQGDMDSAQAFLEKATSLTEDSDELKLIIDAEDRIKSRVEDIAKIQQLSSIGRI